MLLNRVTEPLANCFGDMSKIINNFLQNNLNTVIVAVDQNNNGNLVILDKTDYENKLVAIFPDTSKSTNVRRFFENNSNQVHILIR